MADSPYLVAVALLELDGKRAMPINGKSLTPSMAGCDDPGDDGRTLALELLLRLWQRSDDGPLQRAAGGASLLLMELPMEVMSDQLPRLKASWISGGETSDLLSSLQSLTTKAWTISMAKYEPISFRAWP